MAKTSPNKKRSKEDPAKVALRAKRYRERKKQKKPTFVLKSNEIMTTVTSHGKKKYKRQTNKFLLNPFMNKYFLDLKNYEDRKKFLKERLRLWTTVSFDAGDEAKTAKVAPLGKLQSISSESFEKNRVWQVIYVKPPTGNSKVSAYHHLFTIKKSLIEGAGYGVFAARKFCEGEPLGVFFGKLKPPNEEKTYSNYAIATDHAVMDPEGGIDSPGCPVYFGLHLTNDPKGPIGKSSKKSNFEVHDVPEFAAYATRDISEGEELYLDYGKYH